MHRVVNSCVMCYAQSSEQLCYAQSSEQLCYVLCTE